MEKEQAEAAPPPPPGKLSHLQTPLGLLQFLTWGQPRPGRPALISYPDLGLDFASCYWPLFSHPEMAEIIGGFQLVHLDPPGMEGGAQPYPPGYQYPSLEQLAEVIPLVLQHLHISSIIGIGVGVGAFVLAKFALLQPEAVEGLLLLNINSRAEGWAQWAANKLSSLTSSTRDLILAHLFTKEELAAAPPHVQRVRERLRESSNLPLLWAMYNSRGDLGLERGSSLRCPVLLVVGDGSQHEEAVVEFNSRLDPTQASFLKMADGGGQPQISQPAKLTEAFKYFLQGMGYMPAATMTRLGRSRTASSEGRSRSMSRGSMGGVNP